MGITKDYINENCAKELRESHVCLRIISRAILTDQQEKVESAIAEANELISIFVKSVSTAENRERGHARE